MVLAFTIPYLDNLLALPGGSISAFLVLLCSMTIIFQIALMLLLRIAKLLVGHTETSLDDRILHAISVFLPAIASMTSLYISLQAIYPDLSLGGLDETHLYFIAMLGIGAFLISAVLDAFLVWYGIEIRPRKKGIKDEEVFPFVRDVVKIVVAVVFITFILETVGFDTTAIITGLGVGGIAVALALQDTLGNFFAGVHILMDKPFREDDYVKLDSGAEGVVTEIGWRTTRLHTPTENEIVIPNSKMAGAILENYSNPKDFTTVSYEIGVDYREDIEAVERIIRESLEEAAAKTSLIDEKTIWVRFQSFGDFSLNFKYGYNIKGYVNRFAALKEVNKLLFYNFKKKDINIPFPVRVVYPPPSSDAKNTQSQVGETTQAQEIPKKGKMR